MKVTVVVLTRNVPSVDRTPEAPPGTVRVSVIPGMKGPEALKLTVVGVTICQTPGTAGLSTGIAPAVDSGAEKVTVTPASDATPVAPAAGTSDLITSGGLAGARDTVALLLAGTPALACLIHNPAPAPPPRTTTASPTGQTRRLGVILNRRLRN